MKKIFAFIVFVSIFSGCKKGDLKDIPLEKVWEDPHEKLEKLKEILASSKDGWEYTITYGDHKNVSYGYLGFNTASKSEFVSDFSKNFSSFGSTDYKLAVIQANPSISFKPNSRFSNFAADAKYIDTLWTYKSHVKDTVHLEGELFGSKMKLFKCSSEKLKKLKSNSINSDVEKIKKLALMPRYFYHFQYGTKTIGLEIDTAIRMLRFISGTDQKPVLRESKYYFHGDGITLEKPIILEDKTLNVLEGFEISEKELKIRGGMKILNESVPKVYDQKPVREFEGDFNTRLWWESSNVFGTRHEPDIAGFTKIPGYSIFSLAPYYAYFEEGKVFHWFFGIDVNGMNPGSYAGPLSKIDKNGILSFVKLLESEPAEDPAVLKSMEITNSYIYNPKGFYVIRTGVGYTLVDARDGQTWAYFQAPPDLSL